MENNTNRKNIEENIDKENNNNANQNKEKNTKRSVSRKSVIIAISSVVILLVLSVGGLFIYDHFFKGKKEISMTDMKTQVQLAVYECNYHGVEKVEKSHDIIPIIWNQNKKMWFEYQTKITVGVDVKKMKMDINGDEIVLSIPTAEVIDKPTIDSSAFNKESIITDKSGFLVSDIDVDDQMKVIKKAEKRALKETKGNVALLDSAKAKAKDLMKKYVVNFNKLTGNDYQITFKDI